MSIEYRLRELIGHRVKILGSINEYQRKIDRLKVLQNRHVDKLKTVQAAIKTEKKRIHRIWWWPWGD